MMKQNAKIKGYLVILSHILNMVFLLILAVQLSSIFAAQTTWKDSYNRGNPTLISYCADGAHTKLPDGLCYPSCPALYTAIYTDARCYEPCLYNFIDAGPVCNSNGDYYRDIGKVNTNQCTSSAGYDPTLGCEEVSAGLWYPVCRQGYAGDFWSPNNCFVSISSQTRIIVTRPGVLPICDPLERDPVDGLCYPKCLPGYTPEKNVCWKTACPAGTVACGTALCLDSAITCAGSPEQTQATTVYNQVFALSTGGTTNFVMEDILRLYVGTPASVDGGLTFAQIDAIQVGPRECMQRRFPIIMGSNAGNSYINTMETDGVGNIGVAGSSTDLNIMSASNNVFIGLFEATGYNFTWVREFTVPAGQQVSQLAFKSDNTLLIALLTPTPLTLLVLSTLDGTLLSSLVDPLSNLLGASLAVDPVNHWVYVSATSPTDILTILGVNLSQNPIATSFPSFQITSNQYRAQDSAFIARTFSLLVVARNPGLFATVLAQVQVFYPGGVFTPVLSQISRLPPMTSNYMNHKVCSWSDTATGTDVVFFVGEPQNSTVKGLLIFRRQLAPSIIDEGYIYQENDVDAMKVIDVELFLGVQAYMVFQNTARGKISLLSLTYAGNGSIKVVNKMLNKPILTVSQFRAAKVTASGNFYFAGDMQTLPSANPSMPCMSVAPGNAAFISYTDNTYECQRSSLSASTQYTVNTDLALVFSGLIESGVTSSYSMNIATQTNAIIPQAKLYLTRNTCCDVPITVGGGLGYTKYVIDYPQETYIFPTFSQSTCLDTFQFWYKRDYTIQPALSPATTPYIFFDDNNQLLKFSVYTSDSAMAGMYHIKVTGTLPSHQSATDMFNYLELWNIPYSEFITGVMIDNQTYIATDKPLLIQVDQFIPSNLFHTYYIIYYLEMWDQAKAVWTRDFNANIFTFSQGGRTPNITVYTSENTLKGFYQMRLLGKFTPNTVFQGLSPFVVTVLDQCYLNRITLPPDLPSTLSFSMLDPTAPPLILTFPPWALSMPQCGPIEYKATLDSGLPLPRFISFSQYTRQFVVTQNQYMRPGTYILRLQGKLREFYLMEVMLLSVEVMCQVKKLRPASDSVLFEVGQGAPGVTYQVPEFAQIPACGRSVRYEVAGDGDVEVARYVRYEEVVDRVMGSVQRRVVMRAPAEAEAEEVRFKIAAHVGEEEVSKGVQEVRLKVKKAQSKYTESKYPPIFQTQQAGSSWEVPFVVGGSNPGRVLQSREYKIKLTKKQIKYVSGEISANSIVLVDSTEPASSFDQATGTLTLTPSADTESGTRFAIHAELDDKSTFKVNQDLYMIVYRGTNTINMVEEKFLIQGLLDRTKQEFGGTNLGTGPEGDQLSSLWGSSQPFRLSSVRDKDFTGSILKVSDRGLVTLKFTKDLIPIQNLSAIDNNTLDLRVLTDISTLRDARNLTITKWDVKSMSASQMTIQLKFASPLDISANELQDRLRLEVLNDFLFVTPSKVQGLYSNIKQGTAWTQRMPRQLRDGDQLIVGATGTFASGVFATVLSTALLAALMGSSMMGVWGMINVSQLLMMIPLMNVNIPGNAQAVFTQLQNIISFDLIETGQIPKYDQIFTFKNRTSESQPPVVSPRFDQYGYEHHSLIHNMGSSLLWLALSLVYQVTLLTIHRTLQLLRVKFAYLDRLERDTFFNMTIRMLQEGALEFMIGGTINLLYLDFSTNGTELASSVFSLGILVSLGILIVMSLVTSTLVVYNLENSDKYHRVSAIFDGLRLDNIHRANYQVYQLIRRAFLVAMLIFLKDYTLLQIVLFNFHQLLFTAYLISFRPLEDPKQCNLEIFNECMVTLAAQTLFAFTDFQGSGFEHEGKYLFGWYITSIMLFTVLTNTLISLLDTLTTAYRLLRRRLCPPSRYPPNGDHSTLTTTVSVQPLTDDQGGLVQPPPALMSPREALDKQITRFKSSQEVVGEWIRQVGGVTRVGLAEDPLAINRPMVKLQAPTYERQGEDAEKQEKYATGTFLGLKDVL